MPQIEVTFSIDANGIVNVSATDLDTGKAQAITITATSNMSREEIDRAVRDAQQYAAEDEKLKAEALAKDRCEHLLYRASGAKPADKEQKAAIADAVKMSAAPSNRATLRRWSRAPTCWSSFFRRRAST